MNTLIKPGTCIKLTGLQKAQHHNEKPGVVLKTLENNDFRILLVSGNEVTVGRSNLETIEQCPCERRKSDIPLLCWPKLKDVAYPSLNWVENEDLIERFTDNIEMIETGNCKLVQHFFEGLSTEFGWKTPKMWYSDDGFKNNNRNLFFYDADSEGPVNDWLKKRFKRNSVPVMNGAFIGYTGVIETQISETKNSETKNAKTESTESKELALKSAGLTSIFEQKASLFIHENSYKEGMFDDETEVGYTPGKYTAQIFLQNVILTSSEPMCEGVDCGHCKSFLVEVTEQINTFYPDGGFDQMMAELGD
jgi:hypothetical protein